MAWQWFCFTFYKWNKNLIYMQFNSKSQVQFRKIDEVLLWIFSCSGSPEEAFKFEDFVELESDLVFGIDSPSLKTEKGNVSKVESDPSLQTSYLALCGTDVLFQWTWFCCLSRFYFFVERNKKNYTVSFSKCFILKPMQQLYTNRCKINSGYRP